MALWARIDDKKQRGGLVVSLRCQRWSVWNRRWSVVGGRGARARPGNGDAAAWRSGWRENRREKRRKKMTCGARVSVIGEMKYTSSYMSAARPRLCSYIFSGIFVGNEEL